MFEEHVFLNCWKNYWKSSHLFVADSNHTKLKWWYHWLRLNHRKGKNLFTKINWRFQIYIGRPTKDTNYTTYTEGNIAMTAKEAKMIVADGNEQMWKHKKKHVSMATRS